MAQDPVSRLQDALTVVSVARIHPTELQEGDRVLAPVFQSGDLAGHRPATVADIESYDGYTFSTLTLRLDFDGGHHEQLVVSHAYEGIMLLALVPHEADECPQPGRCARHTQEVTV